MTPEATDQTTPGERLPRLVPAELTEEQRSVYDGIAGGDRAQGVQHFPLTAADGSLHGPFGVMLHAPALGLVLQELGSAIRYRTTLTARIREIAILMVAQHLDSDFEWYAHARVGRAVGLTESELTALLHRRFTSDDAVEQAAAQLCALLLDGGSVDPLTYSELEPELGVEALIELTTLVGYYRTLAQLMDVFAISTPTG